MLHTGRVWKYGDAINTDVIFPGKYTYTMTDPNEWAKHALEDLDATFAGKVQRGDVIVAGKNWGCGSSREQAVGALKYAGVSIIIAKSFARIYFRNCVNQGVLPIVCPAAVDAITPGETIDVDPEAQTIRCAAGVFTFPPLSPTIHAILAAGGLIPMLRKKLGVEHLPMPEIKGGE
jgi:3-isopropylmalate/(R)-2-methylmalate dehydratase small subunit